MLEFFINKIKKIMSKTKFFPSFLGIGRIKLLNPSHCLEKSINTFSSLNKSVQ
jgi:hypothetical protein